MAQETIDLRSDTVTTPCDNMRKVMANAPVGDDVYDEDPTVKKLQSRLAEMAGQEAGLYFPSGTQSNLVALLSHCGRGEEYIVGQEAHTYKYEGGGAAVLGSIQPQPIEFDEDGTMPLDKIEAKIKVDDIHFAITKLIALENTTGGKVIPQDYIAKAAALAKKHNLVFHLDGARAFNAAVAQGLPLDAVTKPFDSVSLCLSKGLGAPVGSVLVGNKDMLKQAKRWRKMVGGGMRQIGSLAAAGIYAIENNIDRLAEDHANAERLAEGLKGIDGLTVVGDKAHTNMVFLKTPDRPDLIEWCAERGLLFSGRYDSRLVVHKQVSEQQVDHAASLIRQYFSA